MAADLAPGIEGAFALDAVEGDGPAVLVEGALPSGFSGTAYWNGPGHFVRGGLRYRHWLDGDGLISSLTFGGTPRFSSRFVRSVKRTEEEAAGRAVYRAFGTRFDGDRLQMGLGLASPVNVSVYPFADTLLAFGEQGLPWSLDASTLETLGEHTFGNALNAVSPFSAHPCFDRSSGEMFAFGVSFAAAAPLVHLYCFDAQGALTRRARVPLPYACTIHDFGISPEFAIFYVSPYVLDAAALLHEGASVREALAWKPELGSRLLIVRRSDFARVGEVPLGERYCLHMINAFEQNGDLVVDVIELDRPVYDQYEVIPDLFKDVARGRPVRMRVDPAAANGPRLLERIELAYDRAPDFPSLASEDALRPYEKFWMLGISSTGMPGRKFFDELVALDWSHGVTGVYRAPRGLHLASEPLVARRADGSVFILCLAFDAGRSATEALLFSGTDVARGPTARWRLPHAVPPMFHGVWTPASLS